ncbi:hypothetical protein AB0F52_46225 [Amycolatopsis sp. NPDC024027]|uniref:hypothetical protein n=1 Tax=Amycolatopsis sp. NPDC024027 TaxID=3154327 RepID=UPI0033E895B2
MWRIICATRCPGVPAQDLPTLNEGEPKRELLGAHEDAARVRHLERQTEQA